MDELSKAMLHEVRTRLVEHYPAQIRACLDVLSEDQIWSRPDPAANAVGNLVLHLCGSTRHFLGRAVGGTDYVRDRPAEFAERGPVAASALRRALDETVAESAAVLDTLTPERLLETSDRAGEPFTVVNLLLRASHHWAVHTGQIVYATKTLRPGAFEELWKRTKPGRR